MPITSFLHPEYRRLILGTRRQQRGGKKKGEERGKERTSSNSSISYPSMPKSSEQLNPAVILRKGKKKGKGKKETTYLSPEPRVAFFEASQISLVGPIETEGGGKEKKEGGGSGQCKNPGLPWPLIRPGP